MDMKKKARVSVLTSDRIDFKVKAIKRDKEGHYIVLKEATHQGDITLDVTHMYPT